MPLSIDVPEEAWSSSNVSLAGTTYSFRYSFNNRDERWRLSIYIGARAIITGVKIMENQLLLRNYGLDDFSHGDLACVRAKQSSFPVGFDNFGRDKEYELVYYSNEEIQELTP